MAQQRQFNQDQQGENNPRDAQTLSSDRGVGTRAAAFVGGDIDPVTGNLMPGSRKTASQGFTVTGSENPAPPPPAAPQIIEQISAQAQTAPTQAATFVRKDKSNGMEQMGKWFCYGWGVEILMEDGSYKAVQELAIGDRVMLGGEVVATGKAKGSFTFVYRDQRVSGNHAVFENGRFVRVYEAEGRSENDDYVGAIYPVATEHFLMVTRTHIGADFTECEGGYDMTPVQRLSIMNRDIERLQWLRTQERRFCRVDA